MAPRELRLAHSLADAVSGSRWNAHDVYLRLPLRVGVEGDRAMLPVAAKLRARGFAGGVTLSVALTSCGVLLSGRSQGRRLLPPGPLCGSGWEAERGWAAFCSPPGCHQETRCQGQRSCQSTSTKTTTLPNVAVAARPCASISLMGNSKNSLCGHLSRSQCVAPCRRGFP